MKRSGNLAKYSPCAAAQIGFVRFCTFSKEELEAWSVMEVTEPKLYEGIHPMVGGPNDLRLGVSSMDQVCQTCGQSRQCQGHFGHIRLVESVYHYGFMPYVQKILKCICHNCSRLKTYYTDQQRDRFKKVNQIPNAERRLRELSKVLGPITQCLTSKQADQEEKIGCGCFIPTKIMTKFNRIIVEQRLQSNKFRQYTYTAQRVMNIFAGINASDAKLLGFLVTKPVDLLISSLAVAPPQIRPRIEMNAEKKAEDDITIAYMKIVSLNNELKNSVQSTERSNRIVELERLIASIMVVLDRGTVNLMQNSTKRFKKHRKIKSIEERLKSKEGRFRQHLMGKRVDFSARSVISPDSNLALDQLGVPEKIANSLTIPEKVTEWNFSRIVQLCKEGKVKYILRPSINNKKYEEIIPVIKLNNSTQQIQKYLSYGTIVERNLQDGDYVLFNRQPTLHRMSMMSHRVRLLPYNTFRLNLSVCTPYNADFDGDEMNMHVPQSFETQAELKCIAHVPKQIIAPKNSCPVMGMVQDSLLGMYLLTMRDTFLTRQQAMNLIIWIYPCLKLQTGDLPFPTLIRPYQLWTGKQIISLLIPSQITLHVKKGGDGFRNVHDTSMLIRHGELLSGALQREVVGSGVGGLIHALWLELGPELTSEFITNSQKVVSSYLMITSFSVGVVDIVTGEHLEDLRKKQSQRITEKYFQNINKYRNEDTLTKENLHQKGKKILNSFECIVNMELNNSLSVMQKILSQKVSSHKNNIYKMVAAKSKGSQTNLAQIMFCLGNQNVDGQRVPLGFTERALPHFRKNDNSPQSRGFVFSSFYQGLKPHQFFFHSMGGRQGLSDTAVKTSSIGYIQRKLVKSLEDLVINYDGTVRDSQNNFLQKLYGQDGFLSEYIERHKNTDCLLSEEQFELKYAWDKLKVIRFSQYDFKKVIVDEWKELNRCRIRMRQIFVKAKNCTEIEYYCPIEILRLIQKIKNEEKPTGKDVVSAIQVVNAVEDLINECIMPQNKKQYHELLERFKHNSHKGQFVAKRIQFDRETGLQIFHMHLRLNLASRIICEVHKLDKNCLQILMRQIKTKFKHSIAPAGEAIGAVAAQSIGEPTTQMTLNTFHLAGVSDRNVTLGIPRLRELLDVSKRIKTPLMSIYHKSLLLERQKQLKHNTDILALMVTFFLPEKHVKDYMVDSKIYYDPYPQASNINAPVAAIVRPERRSPWVLSLMFDTQRIANTRTWIQIKKIIQQHFQVQFQISEKEGFGGQSMPNILMRCFQETKDLLRIGRNQQVSIFKYLNSTQAQIKELFVSGIEGIKTVKISKKAIFDSSIAEEPEVNTEAQDEVMFETEGTNLQACLCHPDLDCERTVSNDIHEIYQLLGIEAARQAFINQFEQILKPYSIYINHRHLSVLADWMSSRGSLTPINRNGINRVKDVSVLRKASFQETVDILFGAATFSETDELRGVSERIIFGQNVNLGTNSFELILDRDMAGQFKYKGQNDRVPLKQQLLDPDYLNSGDNLATKLEETPKRYSSPYMPQSNYMKTPNMSYNKDFTPSFSTPMYSGLQTFKQSPQPSPLRVTSPVYFSNQIKPVKIQEGVPNPLRSPAYTPYYVSGQSSSLNIGNMRSPLYQTPLYPSRHQTSPEYSPISYNSPNYGSVKKEEVRSYNKQEEISDQEEDDE